MSCEHLSCELMACEHLSWNRVPVAVRPSVCGPFVCNNNGTMEDLLGQCNTTINLIAGGECFLCGC